MADNDFKVSDTGEVVPGPVGNETPARRGDNLANGEPMTKLQMVAGLNELMGSMDTETLAKNYAKAVDALKGVTDKAAPGEPMNKLTKESVDLGSSVSDLLEGEDLSEETKALVARLVESTVIDKVNELIETIDTNTREEVYTAVLEDVANQLDAYVTHVAEEWMNENQLAVESGLTVEMANSFLEGMKSLFEQHNIDIPQGKVNVVEEMVEKVEQYKQRLDEQIAHSMILSNEVKALKKEAAIHSISEGLTLTQRSKLAELAEGIDYRNDEQFAAALVDLKENRVVGAPGRGRPSILNEGVDDGAVDVVQESARPTEVDAYVQAIRRTTR